MIHKKKLAGVAALAAAAPLALAGCGGGGGSSTTGGSSSSNLKGGTLYYLMSSTSTPEHLDPQRTYIGRDISNTQRLVYRGLLTFPVTTDPTEGAKPVPDLATDTGKSLDNAKTWQFTLKDGVKWQDGKPVTCADLKYGVSRTFATDVITGGPNYALTYLNIPKKPDGSSTYSGPYTKKNQAAFDKAVTCSSDNKTITYHFNKPWPDFPLAIASLDAFAPYRQDQDHGDSSNFAVFSDGPYMIQGTWNKDNGGTFVRNPNWDPKTDTVRKAYPDKIVFQVVSDTSTVIARLIKNSGTDQYAVTDRRIDPPNYAKITGDVAKRSTLVTSPYVDYLIPNFKKITNLKVREALAVSTNRAAWIAAGGGDKAYIPAKSVVSPSVIGYKPNPYFTSPDTGDTAKAKQLLKSAGVPMPYPVKFTYPTGTSTADKMAAALQQTWNQAGFKVTLDPQGANYYTNIQNPGSNIQLTWAGWGADWPSISAVIPPLFDGRINLTKNSTGSDYGNYNSPALNALIDQGQNASSVQAAVPIWQKADAQLGKDVAYIPLEVSRFYFLHGSKVTNYTNGAGTSTYVDLGDTAVAH